MSTDVKSPYELMPVWSWRVFFLGLALGALGMAIVGPAAPRIDSGRMVIEHSERGYIRCEGGKLEIGHVDVSPNVLQLFNTGAIAWCKPVVP